MSPPRSVNKDPFRPNRKGCRRRFTTRVKGMGRKRQRNTLRHQHHFRSPGEDHPSQWRLNLSLTFLLEVDTSLYKVPRRKVSCRPSRLRFATTESCRPRHDRRGTVPTVGNPLMGPTTPHTISEISTYTTSGKGQGRDVRDVSTPGLWKNNSWIKWDSEVLPRPG